MFASDISADMHMWIQMMADNMYLQVSAELFPYKEIFLEDPQRRLQREGRLTWQTNIIMFTTAASFSVQNELFSSKLHSIVFFLHV